MHLKLETTQESAPGGSGCSSSRHSVMNPTDRTRALSFGLSGLGFRILGEV